MSARVIPIGPARQARAARRLGQRAGVAHWHPGFICPACWHRAFHIGRATAECGKCGAAYPIAAAR